jgi:hypothetical protein
MYFRMLRTQNRPLKTPLPPQNAINEIQPNTARPTQNNTSSLHRIQCIRQTERSMDLAVSTTLLAAITLHPATARQTAGRTKTLTNCTTIIQIKYAILSWTFAKQCNLFYFMFLCKLLSNDIM